MAPSNSNAAKTEAQVEVEGCFCSRGMAGLETKRRRSAGNGGAHRGGTGGGHGLGSLTGIGAVQHAFHFLDGPADVLRASTASRRWRELACGDVVWRPKAVREGMVEKAGVFEVALPAAAAAAGDGGSSSSGGSAAATTAAKKDELAGVGLSFYSQIYVLKVMDRARLALAPHRADHHHRSPRSRRLRTHHHPSASRSRPLGRGTR